MEVRQPLLSAEEIAGLLGGRPPTVEQMLRAELLEAPASVLERPTTGRGLRRLIAGVLHVAANAIYPPGGSPQAPPPER